MSRVFTFLSSAVEGVPSLAIIASFIWGTLSVLLSPCHLTSIPLIIGYISNREETSAKKAFFLSTLFSVGVLMSFSVIGGITAAAGRIIGDIGKIGNYAVAVIFLIFGLNLLGILRLNWTGLGTPNQHRRGYFPILILGFVFGLALGPCTFAFMAPMLGIVFNLTAFDLLYGLLLLAAFGAGHCFVIVAAGTSSQWVQRIAKLNEKSKGITNLRRLCGVLVLLGGIYLVYVTF